MFDEFFNYHYENYIIELSEKLVKDKELISELKDKRAFGLEKYKDISFQSNQENAMLVNTLLHAQEELIDALNYLMHEHYKRDGNFLNTFKVKCLIRRTVKLYKDIKSLGV